MYLVRLVIICCDFVTIKSNSIFLPHGNCSHVDVKVFTVVTCYPADQYAIKRFVVVNYEKDNSMCWFPCPLLERRDFLGENKSLWWHALALMNTPSNGFSLLAPGKKRDALKDNHQSQLSKIRDFLKPNHQRKSNVCQ